MGVRGGMLSPMAEALDAPIDRFARRATAEVGKDLQRRVRRHTPVAKHLERETLADFRRRRARRPGTLRDSWQVGDVDVELGGRRYTIPVFTTDPVAPHVEWDTRPHIIRAKRAPFLVFETEGGTVFAKLVHHPGTTGAHMMATAIAETAATWRATVGEEWRLTARLFWRGGGAV